MHPGLINRKRVEGKIKVDEFAEQNEVQYRPSLKNVIGGQMVLLYYEKLCMLFFWKKYKLLITCGLDYVCNALKDCSFLSELCGEE